MKASGSTSFSPLCLVQGDGVLAVVRHGSKDTDAVGRRQGGNVGRATRARCLMLLGLFVLRGVGHGGREFGRLQCREGGGGGGGGGKGLAR
jgi:hypothetical protein